MFFPKPAAVRVAVKGFTQPNNRRTEPTGFPAGRAAFFGYEDPRLGALEQGLNVRLFCISLFA
eukprot:2991578-Lingulodinium_polyedra.AAC.1